MKETSSTQVSVVIPVRNGYAYLKDAVSSVINQSFCDFEIVVVNDGSTDGDYNSLTSVDPRIRVLHLTGCGVSTARNYGLREARGDLIAFLDADDVWFPGKLDAQVNYMREHPEVGVVFGAFQKWEAGPSGNFPSASSLMSDCSALDRPAVARSGWLYTRLLMGLLVGMNTALVRRSLVNTIGGFNTSLVQAEDYDFWIKASRVAEMHALDGAVALYRIHPASAMHRLTLDNALVNVLGAARQRWGLSGPGGDTLDTKAFQLRIAQIQFDHGYVHFWHGDIVVARQAFRSALQAGFRSRRSAAYLALSYLPFRLGTGRPSGV
jgi:glycosyltransferase involved in cell wall biosynthesis